MLEWIRENKRWAQLVLIALIFPFACTGIEGYRRMQGDADTLAKVDGQKISRADFENARSEQLQRMKQMLGDSVDERLFDNPQARQAVLDQLITQRALLAEAQRAKLAISDAQLREVIAAVPAFQEDGRFSDARYQQYLATQNLSGIQFDARVRQDLALQQIARYPAESAWSPAAAAAVVATAFEQERVVAAASFAPAAYLARAAASDEAIKAYYDANQKSFETPEQADIEYLVLSPDAIASGIKVSADDVKQYYEQNQSRFSTIEQRRASHILIAVPSGANAETREQARAKAQGILDQVRKAPGDFAKLARQYSDDPGSKERGGDLDYFSKGAMVKPFEDAVFALKQGEVSDLVQTDFGYHIIELTGVRPGQVKPVEEVRGQIEAEIRRQLAAAKVAEAQELFTDTVYEQADSLEPAAEKLGLGIQTAKGFTRENPAAANPLLANPKFLAAIFGDDAVREKHNTQAIEVAPSTLVAGRVVAFTPRATRSLEQVRPQIAEAVRREEALKLARADGEARLAHLKAGKGEVAFGAPVKVTRQNAAGLPPEAVRQVFRANASKLPAFVGVELGPNGYAVYRLDAVSQPAASDALAAQRKALAESLNQAYADAELAATVEAVRARAKVEVTQSLAAADAN